jgi:hypothetical protein
MLSEVRIKKAAQKMGGTEKAKKKQYIQHKAI